MAGNNESAGTASYVEFASAGTFAQTLERLERRIEAQSMTIFAKIDHAAGAREAGMAMPPAVVLIYGNPRGGTPIMQAAPRAALDLPLRILVREDLDGRVWIGFHPVTALLADAGVPNDLVTRLEAAQTLIADGLRS